MQEVLMMAITPQLGKSAKKREHHIHHQFLNPS